jgi:hypothetical protein
VKEKGSQSFQPVVLAEVAPPKIGPSSAARVL